MQEIREEFEPKNATELDEDKISTEAHLVNFGWDRCKEKLFEKLDKIEGENNGRDRTNKIQTHRR